MKKFYLKTLALLLIFTLLFSCVPMRAFALETTTDEKVDEALSNASDVKFISELEEKREANRKVFLLSDGSYLSAEYPQQVHFKENGYWKDYDNTLTEVDSKDNSEKEYENNISDVKVKLSKKTNGKKFITVEKDGYKLYWYYKNANKVTGTIRDNTITSDETVLDKLTSTIVYSGVYKDVDLEYIVLPSAVKENIILKSSSAQTVFESEYKSNNLTPKQYDDRTIVLENESGDKVYTISAPFMEDSNGAYCDSVVLKLGEIKSNSFEVIISLDENWLLSNDRKYPVLVDPVLMTKQDKSVASSAFVSSSNPNKCYLATTTGDMGSLYVGNISGFGQTESYIKFTSLPALGVADRVIDARLYIGLRKCELGLVWDVKRLTSSWEPNTVTWNNRPQGEGSISDFLNLTEQTDTSVFQEFEITEMVCGWYSKNLGM